MDRYFEDHLEENVGVSDNAGKVVDFKNGEWLEVTVSESEHFVFADEYIMD